MNWERDERCRLSELWAGRSVPFWPLGCEYRITFRGSELSREDLRSLSVLNEMAGWGNDVGIMFADTNVTRNDVLELRRRVPRCHVFSVVQREIQDDR